MWWSWCLKRRWEPFWTYVVLGFVASGVPAAISDVGCTRSARSGSAVPRRPDVPALVELRERINQRTARVVLVVAADSVAAQSAFFHE